MRPAAVFMAVILTTMTARGAVSPAAIAGAEDSTYTLTGKIEGMNTGWVFLLHIQSTKGILDSVKSDKQGRFSFTGKITTPELCGFAIYGTSGSREFRTYLFLQRGHTTVNGAKQSMGNAVVEGGAVQTEFLQYQAAEKTAVRWDLYRDAYKAAKAKNDKRQLDSLDKASDLLEKADKEFAARYAASHPDSYVSLYELNVNYSYNPDVDELQGLLSKLNPTVRDTYFGQQLKEAVEAGLRTSIGREAPAFTQADTLGKLVTLSSFRGRYVLVDFWASWCGPCRAENPAVVKAYQQFHDKGFDIVGVSLDEKKDKWLEAIKKDGLAWQHVSDLKGWENSVAEIYGVKGIPMNYLLDKDGKIIAKGLRGEELEQKLAELVH
jgi:peroxiredoxin